MPAILSAATVATGSVVYRHEIDNATRLNR